MSYLPTYLPRILKYFRPYLNQPELSSAYSWWFEFENVPVRWNWPIGLSYDLLTGLDPANYSNRDSQWKLTLHYKDYPVNYLLALPDEIALPDYWLNQSKEACFIRDGTATAIMNLSKDTSENMWRSVEQHDSSYFWGIMDKLLPSKTSLRNIPLKIYLPVSNKAVQSLVRPVTDDGSPQTLGGALHHLLPDLFPSKRTCILSKPVLHGVIVPMTADLTDLLYQAMYKDGFLHISLVMMS